MATQSVAPFPVRAGSPGLLVTPIDRNPRAVAFAATWPGKLAILASASVLLQLRGLLNPSYIFALGLITFFPQRRSLVMALAGLYWARFLLTPPVLEAISKRTGQPIGIGVELGAVAAAFLMGALLKVVICRWPTGMIARNPRLTLLGIWAIALAAALNSTTMSSRVALWAFAASLSGCLWFFSYTLTDGARNTGTFLSQLRGVFSSLFSLWPVKVISTTPFLKRPSTLARMEAKTTEEFAVAQLKGLKLLAWAVVLGLLWATFSVAAGALHIPQLLDAMSASSAGHPFPWYMCWASLFVSFVDSVLGMTVWGHTVVAGCRLAGFKLLRNTYRPMRARTVADFWNCYYYYFKELIADFFFFPVYMRCFRNSPKIRTLFATWVAVGLGIPLFHFIRDIHFIAELGFWRALTGFHVYLCYATMLSFGIGISQMRKTHRPKTPGPVNNGNFTDWFRYQFMPTAGVVLFFCFLQIFDDLRRTVPLSDHILFLTRFVGG